MKSYPEIGKLIIITGRHTGSGKDTVINYLLSKYPKLHRVVTTTTRSPRAGEIDGVNHHFITASSFKNLQQKNALVEWNTFANNFYGTQKKDLERILYGESLLWRIDPERASQIEQLIYQSYDSITAEKILQNTITIFIDVPDIETIYRRLRKRGMDEDTIKQRLVEDWNDPKKIRENFKNIVVNRDNELEVTLQSVEKLINLS